MSQRGIAIDDRKDNERLKVKQKKFIYLFFIIIIFFYEQTEEA